jgi:hypothetical protein
MRQMNKLIPGIRITGPAFVEGRGISALALQFTGMRHLFHGNSATLFEATPSSRRRR